MLYSKNRGNRHLLELTKFSVLCISETINLVKSALNSQIVIEDHGLIRARSFYLKGLAPTVIKSTCEHVSDTGNIFKTLHIYVYLYTKIDTIYGRYPI